MKMIWKVNEIYMELDFDLILIITRREIVGFGSVGITGTVSKHRCRDYVHYSEFYSCAFTFRDT